MILQKKDSGWNRKYHLEFDPFLNSQTAACRSTLRDRVIKSLERMSASPQTPHNDVVSASSFDNVVVGLNIGVCRRLEKLDPGQTVENLIQIYRQFQEKVKTKSQFRNPSHSSWGIS